MQIDIIIPVYNGYDDIIKCMESIRKHTDLKKHRVILVNDKSPDERIVPYLESQAEENIIFIDSEVNQGFSASVNKGITWSDRDVVLLNSDTMVTRGWVDKLVACAYSDSEIGTVTPFSNSATLCSVPNFCEDNDIPENVTLDEMAEIIERTSICKYSKITVAVGFCMYIKRSVIEDIGLFDAETFGKGYGEENDFCNRLEQYGYRNVLCDNTFIYHKGTVSFQSEEKKKLIEEHNSVLYQRYPEQMRANEVYCFNNPDQDLRDYVEPFWRLKNGKKNVLYVIHSDFREDSADHVGGTQLHLKDLVLHLKDEYNIFVVSRDSAFIRLTIYVGDSRMSYRFYVGTAEKYFRFYDKKIAKIFAKIFSVFSIDIMHVHHVHSLSLDMFRIAGEYQVPIALTLHDYYYICPTIKMYMPDRTSCAGIKEPENCKECLFARCGIHPCVDYMEKWRREMRGALQKCDYLITPSNAAKRIYENYYPELAQKIKVIEHGLDMPELVASPGIMERQRIHRKVKYFIDKHLSKTSDVVSGWAYFENVDSENVGFEIEVTDKNKNIRRFPAEKIRRPDLEEKNALYAMSGFEAQINTSFFVAGKLKIRVLAVLDNQECAVYEERVRISSQSYRNNGNLNVAFIGGLSMEKGSRIVKDVIKKQKTGVNWYIFGQIGDREVEYLEQSNLVKTGAYQREELRQLFETYHIDLVCILPEWPETFCYTLSEAVMCGIPVVVSDLGAIADRVREHGYGWVVSVKDAVSECTDIIKKIAADKNLLSEKKTELENMQFVSIAQMCEEYKHLYEDIFEEKPVKQNTLLNMSDEAKFFFYEGMKAGNSNMAYGAGGGYEIEKQLNAILSSTSYKAAQFMAQMRIPFKRQIRNLLYWIYRLKEK